MPAKHKRKQKRKQPSKSDSQKDIQKYPQQQQPNPQQQQIIPTINLTTNNNQAQSRIQISSAQAEIYFEYLRKKISHQANDPFSLPFLNLKFQELESWKGATQQLNLESRIYGMRVDNCHEFTVKMLNYVIRNQEEQIGVKTQSKGSVSQFQSDPNKHHSQSQTNYNFHLQKPQKLQCKIQLDKNLSNHSLWKVIFKKSETLEKIQLNTLEISNDLALEIDEKNVSWCKCITSVQNKDDQQIQEKAQIHKQSDSLFVQSILNSYRFPIDKLSIFKQISTMKSDISKQIQQILMYKHQRQHNQHQQRQLQEPLYENYFGYQQLDFDGMYQEFNQFTRYQQNAKLLESSQKTHFNDQYEDNRQEVFAPLTRELYSIPIEHLNMMNSQMPQFQHQLQSESDGSQQQQGQQGYLYEPHKDILFHSTLKKARASKKFQARNIGKRRKNYKTLIDFYDPSVMANRQNVFKEPKQVRNNIQNDNLVPINYVVLYENRNPFRKAKKVTKNHNRISFYDNNLHSQPLMDYDQENARGRQSLNNTNVSQSYEEPFANGQSQNLLTHNNNLSHLEGQTNDRQRHYRNVSMKTVKNEINKEIFNIIEETSHAHQSQQRRLSNFSIVSQPSAMDSYLQQEGKRIGLKFLKQKMMNYDPLDILMSMLHVAYENQVMLQPVYMSTQGDNEGIGLKLKDIIIQGQSF